jgi:hypothetical protein
MIALRHCRQHQRDFGIETTFSDGSTSANWPPADEAFLRIVRECGFDNPLSYIRDHDLTHAFLAEKMFDAPSPVLWSAAHGGCLGTTESLFEERFVYHWQRYAKGIISPLEREWTLWLPEYQRILDEML